MIDLSPDIHPLTHFKRNTTEFMKQLKENGQPVVLTVNGKAELVVQDAEAYRRLLEMAGRAEAVDGIRRGLDDVEAGRTQPVAEALAAIRREFGIPRDT